MKKYLIINDNGDKKTVYAKDLIQALKLSDAVNITPGMFISLKVGPQRCVYRVKEINHGKYGVVLVCYTINEDGQLVERDAGGNYSFDSLKKNVTNIFNTYDEAKKYLLHHDAVRTAYITGLKSLRKKNDSVDVAVIDKPIDTADEAYNPEYSIQQFKSYIHNVIKDLYGDEYNSNKVRAISKLDAYVSQVIDDFEADIKNSNLDKRKIVQYYTQYVDALYKELADVANVRNIDGQSLKKIGDIHAEMARSIHDSIKVADSSLNDSTYELYLGNNLDSIDRALIRNAIKRYGLYVEEYRKGMQTITVHGDRKNIEKLLEYFGHHKGYSKEYNNIKDSKIADIEPISHYIEAWRISNLAADLLYEAQKYGYSFDDVLKKYDAMTSKILALVKNKINEERNNMIDWKQNHPDKLK